jgi:hypothetical protein
MPRGSSSRRASASRAGTATMETNENTENVVSSAVDEDLDGGPAFEIVSEPAPADYAPERKTPGRQRRPSAFDEILRADGVFGAGWQKVPVQSQEHKDFVLRELNRAKLFLNQDAQRRNGEPEIGLDLDPSKDDAVYYKSRVAQKRERKANGDSALVENAQADGTYDPDGDNDE